MRRYYLHAEYVGVPNMSACRACKNHVLYLDFPNAAQSIEKERKPSKMFLFSQTTEPQPNPAENDQKIKEENAKIDRSIRILTIVVIALAAVFLINMLAQNVIRPSLNYKNGTAAMQNGRYADAISYFSSAGDYKDAEEQTNRAKQLHANQLAGKEGALSYTSAAMPWYAVDEDGMFSFAKDTYEDHIAAVLAPGEIIIPDVLDGILVTSIKEKTFLNADMVTSLQLPDSVTAIPDSCFYNCTAMETVILPNKLVSLAQRAFINCSALREITLPETVSEIGLRAFNNCHALERVTISGTALKALQPYTFSDCYALREVTLPASVETIAENAFLNCQALETVYFGGTEAQWNAIAVGEGNEALANAAIVFAQ